MKKIKRVGLKKFGEGPLLKVRKGHRVELGTTQEPLSVQAGLALFYGMAESLNIPEILDEEIRVKCRAAGYPESEHILALSASMFQGGDFVDDMEALREDTAAKVLIGREETPDPTTAGDFCRRFYAGHVLQFDSAMAKIFGEVYRHRKEVTHLTIDLDAKVHPVYGEQKQGAAKSYNGVYLLCAALAYNLAVWIRDLALPSSYRRAYMKKLRRRIGLIASKVTWKGGRVRLLLSQWHLWVEDFRVAWRKIPALQSG